MLAKKLWTILVTAGVLAGAARLAAEPVGTGFTYQGQLKRDGTPVSGLCDFKFSLWTAQSDGLLLGIDQKPGERVTNGLFTVTLNEDAPPEFGADAFTGERRYLQVEVCCDATCADLDFAELPRQELTPSPYAMRAIAGGGDSLWTLNGSGDIHYSDGNVGIGRIDPLASLHVDGNIKVGDGAREFSLREVTTADPGWGNLIKFGGIGFGSTTGANGQMFMFTDGSRSDNIFTIATREGASAVWNADFVATQNGSVGIGTPEPLAKQHVRGSDLGLNSAALNNDDLIIEQRDSVIGLYSDGFGSWGSALSFAEMDPSGNLLDKWTLARRTSVSLGGSALRLTFGPNASYASNPTIMTFAPSGGVGIGTSDPDSMLHVRNFGAQVHVEAIGPQDVAEVYLSEGGDSGIKVSYSTATNSLDFVPRFRGTDQPVSLNIARSTGNVGVGAVPGQNRLRVHANTNSAAIWADNTGIDGFAGVFKSQGTGSTLWVEQSGGGDVITGVINGASVFRVANNGRTKVQVLEITGADLAERFPVSEETKPGMVVAIDPDHAGLLHVARGAYNRRVAGVVSGANGLSVGVILGNLPGQKDAPPIAMSGRVWVHCDTSNGPIRPGDLLTTSDMPGHAMKVTDSAKAQGAIIGKAMTTLDSDKTGLVLVLVSLQ